MHGKKAAQDAELTAKETFEQKGIGKNLPEIIIKQSTFSKGINIIDLLSANKIMDSKSEARRAVKNNGIKINDIMTSDDKRIIVLDDFKENSCIKISHGKKKHFIIKLI